MYSNTSFKERRRRNPLKRNALYMSCDALRIVLPIILSVLYLLIYLFSVNTSNSLPKVISMKPWDIFPFYNWLTLYTATQVRNLNVIVQSFVVCVCFGCTTARLSNLFPLCFVQSGNTFKPTPTTLPPQWNVTASAYRHRILNCFGAIQFAEQSHFKHVFTNDRQ